MLKEMEFIGLIYADDEYRDNSKKWYHPFPETIKEASIYNHRETDIFIKWVESLPNMETLLELVDSYEIM